MVVIIGTTTADVLVSNDEPATNTRGDGFRATNLTFTDTPACLRLGGNGAISAYVLAGLGVPTALCSAVGQDQFGNTLVTWLQSRSIRLDGLARSHARATSTSVIITADASHQTVFHHLGSTVEARFEDMPEDLFTNASVLLASSFPIMTNMRSGGFAQALTRTHTAGGITALDIGPAIGDPVTLDEILPLLPAIDYLIANSHELTELTGASDWEVAAMELVQAGAQRLVVKRGEDGASIRGGEAQVDTPAFQVKANISVGAGDAFNVGFLHGEQQQWPPERALRFGCALAALVVSSKQGVLESPTLDQVEDFLAANH